MTNTFLRQVLALDAIVSALAALILLIGAGMLAPMLELQRDILFAGGVALVPFVALVGWLAAQASPPRGAVWLVIAINALWVLGSIALLASGIERPNTLGYAFVIAQAVFVGVAAELQYVGLRRAARLA